MKQVKKNTQDIEPLNKISRPEEIANESEIFNFIKVFIGHIKAAFIKFRRKDLSSVKNSEFIELGRSDEEKERISEMCELVDEEYRLLADLRTSGLSPEDWIRKKGAEILEDCTPEEREEIIHIVKEEAIIEVEVQANALDAEIEDIQNNQDDSKEE